MASDEEEWMTGKAKAAFENWVWTQSDQWRVEGADPLEIREDVEDHLRAKYRELGRLLEVEDLEGILGAMRSDGNESIEDWRKPKRPFFPFGWLSMLHNRFFLGVWPLLIIVMESASGMFEGFGFDPISRFSQLILLLFVGVMTALGQFLDEKKRERSWFGFLLGVGLIPAVYWGLICLPVLWMGAAVYVEMAFGSMGLALIGFPIVLICMLIAGAPIFASLCLWEVARAGRGRDLWWAGLGVGLVILSAVEVPGYVTRYGLKDNDPALVRNWGSEELLSQIASGDSWRMSHEDTSGLVMNFGSHSILGRGRHRTNEDVVRNRRFYYRVTGKNVLSEDISLLSQRRRSRRSFDADMGGDRVGGIVEGLELSESRLDGHVDGASGLGYWEWTMEFSNNTKLGTEARMQILLPSGGVVSRLTLWVNGEPQEAAFGAKSQVTAAYKSVVQRRRDPVLVRWVGGDRVLVQCFPVPPRWKMKIRIGITASLDGRNRLYLPRLLEKNFAFEDRLETAVWVQGDVEMSMAGLKGKGSAGRWRETHGQLALESLTSKHTHVLFHGDASDEVVWTEDQFAEPSERYLVRQRLQSGNGEARRVVLVVDGSAYFEEWSGSFLKAVDRLREEGHQVEIVYAAEEGVFEERDQVDFVGGQDNVPALRRGLELASEINADEMIWLHGEQPVELDDAESFVQLAQRGFSEVRVSTMDLTGGPNRLLEQIQTSFEMGSAGRPSSPDDLINELLKAVTRNDEAYRYSRVGEGETPDGTKVWDQLARWKVWEDVKREAMAGENRDQLAKQAALYQLVTPVSGAVVLETQEQFERFKLDQVDESTTPSIPGIPEPSSALFVILSTLMVCGFRRRSTP